jgi:hypothetical protein
MMTKRRIPGMAILRDIQRQKEEKKQLQKEMFRQVYNRPKEKAFSDIDQLNMDSFRAIPKSVILDYGLSKAALAVYPVLAVRPILRRMKPSRYRRKILPALQE